MKINPYKEKRNLMNRKYDRLFAILYALLMITLVFIVAIVGRKLYIMKHPEAMTEDEIVRERIEDYKDAEYIDEVYYDGADVSFDCFDLPFIEDDEKDITGFPVKTNKEFIDEYGESNAETIENMAEEYLKTIFGNNYRNIMADTESFTDVIIGSADLLDEMDINSANLTGDGAYSEGVSATDIANALADMYVSNNITTEFEYKTDKSLVWYKFYCFYNRGDMTITFHSTEHEAGDLVQELYDTYGIEIYYEEPFEVIAEVGLLENSNYDVMDFVLYK